MGTFPRGDTFTLYLDSGGSSGIELLPDSTGVTTYAHFRAYLAAPIKFDNAMQWFCVISEAVYKTPPNNSSSIVIQANCIQSSQFNSTSTQALTRIPPPVFPGSIVLPGSYTATNFQPNSWPVPYIQQTTIIPWAQVNSGSITQIEVTFIDARTGLIIQAPVIDGEAHSIGLTFRYFGNKSF